MFKKPFDNVEGLRCSQSDLQSEEWYGELWLAVFVPGASSREKWKRPDCSGLGLRPEMRKNK